MLTKSKLLDNFNKIDRRILKAWYNTVSNDMASFVSFEARHTTGQEFSSLVERFVESIDSKLMDYDFRRIVLSSFKDTTET